MNIELFAIDFSHSQIVDYYHHVFTDCLFFICIFRYSQKENCFSLHQIQYEQFKLY